MTIKLKRYHKDIYFPPWYEKNVEAFLKQIRKTSALVFSLHAVDKIITYSFEYGQKLQKYLLKAIRKQQANVGNVFEFYAVEENIRKACFRLSFDEFPVDLILVISADGTVITVYVINKNDNHSTLDKNLYEKG